MAGDKPAAGSGPFPGLAPTLRRRLYGYGWLWVWRPLAVALVCVDFDRVVEVFDAYGREACERMLQAAADQVQAGHGLTHRVLSLACPVEWVVVVPGGRRAALAWAENVRARVEQHARVGSHPVTIRIGIEAETRGLRRPCRRPLLMRAELAEREANDSGGNCIRLYQPDQYAIR